MSKEPKKEADIQETPDAKAVKRYWDRTMNDDDGMEEVKKPAKKKDTKDE